jgi:hypothetical protein
VPNLSQPVSSGLTCVASGDGGCWLLRGEQISTEATPAASELQQREPWRAHGGGFPEAEEGEGGG